MSIPRDKQEELFNPCFNKLFLACVNQSPSVRLSKFQRIGCIIDIISSHGMLNNEKQSKQREIAVQHLFLNEGFKLEAARSLLTLESHKQRFEIVWNQLSEYEQALALWLNYEVSTNYWPYWEIYNQTLLPYIFLPSGNPEGIIGAPATQLSSFQRIVWDKVEPHELAKTSIAVEDERYVLEAYNFWESSSRDMYFPASQKIPAILGAFDFCCQTVIDKEDARSLLLQNGLSDCLIRSVIDERRWPWRFKLIWDAMSDKHRAELIADDWSWYDNYWPGLDIYNQTLRSSIKFECEMANDIVAECINASFGHESHELYSLLQHPVSKELDKTGGTSVAAACLS